jgi:WD40 repeat protein/serine/threonine protein kinase
MSAPAGHYSWTLPLSLERCVDERCQQFEQAWKSAGGTRPALDAYLDGVPQQAHQVLLLELLRIEAHHRRRLAEDPVLEEYRRRFPDLDPEHLAVALAQPPAPDSSGKEDRDAAPGAVLAKVHPDDSARAAWTLPGYELLGELGRGGMGVVYRARQIKLNRIVALKLLAGGPYAGTKELLRHRYEAEAVAQLQHPNIVQIYEVGEHAGHAYLILEYVPHGSLDKYLGGVPQPARAAAQMIETLAEAVHYAHQRGIVHRDLKPANVLLQELGARRPGSGGSSQQTWIVTPPQSPLTNYTPKIADFGLAKILSEAGAALTASGDVIGTPSYMAPEQASGKRNLVGPAIDVYGLGALLYELLTGRPPFRAETALETVLQVRSQEPVSPSQLQPSCPRDLVTICLKCLRKEAVHRYATAQELADDLRRFLAGESIRARPVSAWGRAAKWARRRPAVAALLAGIVAVTLLGLAGIIWQWRVAETRRFEAEGHRVEAETRSYFDRIARAYQELLAHNVVRANQLLDECYKETPQLCCWEWDFLKRRCNKHLLSLEGHTLDVHCVTFSPDGRLLASCSGEWNSTQPGEVIVWDAASGARLHTFSGHQQAVYCVAFHPDGRRLASAGRDGLVLLWDLDNPEAKPVVLDQKSGVFCVAFSPSGKRLAAGCRDGQVRVTELATGRLLYAWRLHRGTDFENVFSVAYSRDGRYLASAGRDGWVWLVEAEDGKEVRRFPHAGDTRRVAFSPDGRWLASGAWDGTVKLLDLTRTETEPILYHLQAGTLLDLAFSPDSLELVCSTRTGGVMFVSPDSGHRQFSLPENLGVLSLAFRTDGQRLATAGEQRLVKVWDLTGTQEPRLFVGHDRGAVYSFAISPDQQWLALAGAYNTGYARSATTLWLVDLAQDRFLHEFAGHSDSLTCVAVRPDGQQLATASIDKTARLWDVASGKQERTLNHGGPVTGVVYSPDGKSVATSCADRLVRLWDLADARLRQTFAGHVKEVTGVAFAPNGRYLVSAGTDQTLRVWEVATGRALGEYRKHEGAVGTVVFNRDGTRLASADVRQTLWLWHFSAAGQLTPATAPVQLGPPTSAKTIAVLGRSRQGITSLAFSPDGQRLASVSPDRPVQLWDVTTGGEVLTLPDTPDWPACVAFTPDGHRLVLSTAAGAVAVWDAEFLDDKARAQAAAERVRDWHWRRTQSAENNRAWFAEIFHASRGLAAQPQDAKWYNCRGWAYGYLGKWDELRADSAQAIHLSPEDSQLWYRHAIACLGAGDQAAYHDACARMLKHFVDKPAAALDCLYACAPDAKAAGNPEQLVAIGQAALQAQPKDDRRSYGVVLRVYGVALYRAGRYQEASKALEEAREYFSPQAWDWLFVAMACHHCGEDAKARDAFGKAVMEITAAGQARDRNSTWFHWCEQVEVEALRREAQTLLGGMR